MRGKKTKGRDEREGEGEKRRRGKRRGKRKEKKMEKRKCNKKPGGHGVLAWFSIEA